MNLKLLARNSYFTVNRGISRSVACAAGYLMFKHKISTDDALNMIKTHKHFIDPNI